MVIAVCTALAAGCAAGNHTPTPNAPASSPAGTTTAPEQTPEQRAEADAAAILALFAVPPGAVKLSGAPSVGHGVLDKPATSPFTSDAVDDAAWWEVPGQPQQVVSWEQAHMPHRFSASGYSSGRDGNVPYWADDFTLPAITGVLFTRELMVDAEAAGNGRTDLLVNAQVIWIPARPASEVVPSAARVVTLSLLPNLNSTAAPPGPVTITDPARVRALAALVDGLPLFPPVVFSCPAGFGDVLVLTFRARAGGPVLAVATVELSSCEGVDFTVSGKNEPGLGSPDGGRAFAAQVLKTAGLHWQLPTP